MDGPSEWRTGVCEKPRIKCGDCGSRLLVPLSDAVLYDHLAGKHTVGVYPLLEDDTCHFLAIDFDEAEWKEDARAFVQSCTELGVPAALEISRSGNGAHVWVFFAGRVPARDARRLGTAIISHTCSRTRQLKLASYDRLFPNQDTMPKGGFGNLVALPLQKIPRENGCSVFVDMELRPFDDTDWATRGSTLGSAARTARDRQGGWGGVRPSTAGHPGAGDAGVVEGYFAVVCRPAAPRACQQDRRADHRFRGHGPPGAAADVGQAPARIQGHGVSNRRMNAVDQSTWPTQKVNRDE